MLLALLLRALCICITKGAKTKNGLSDIQAGLFSIEKLGFLLFTFS